MNKYKKLILILFVLLVSLQGYGMYLWFQKPYFEDRPAQIEGLECEEYQFTWYNPESKDTVYSTAWEFSPEQFRSARVLLSEVDTTWTYQDNGTVVEVYWSKELTVETRTIDGEVLSYTVYRSESF